MIGHTMSDNRRVEAVERHRVDAVRQHRNAPLDVDADVGPAVGTN